MGPGGNDDQKSRGPRINVSRSLGDVIDEVERLAKDLRKGLARTEALLWELYTMERALAERDAPAPKRRAPHPSSVRAGPAPTTPAACLPERRAAKQRRCGRWSAMSIGWRAAWRW